MDIRIDYNELGNDVYGIRISYNNENIWSFQYDSSGRDDFIKKIPELNTKIIYKNGIAFSSDMLLNTLLEINQKCMDKKAEEMEIINKKRDYLIQYIVKEEFNVIRNISK